MTEEIDKDTLASIDKGMAESARGQVIDRGSFAKYVDEIREGVAEQIFWTAYLFNPVQGANWGNISEAERDGFRKRADRILKFLDSKNVVRRIKEELPKGCQDCAIYESYSGKASKLLKAGYALTERLIDD